ncbi:ABC transporter permease [Vreelandella profundi]|uniref:ABC transporter permease n=1 Tax=Vreelandella profundi TaxID=2852117 RepID=UPI001EF093E1|nr:ABC transporter permease [Halomonas profundi]
MKILAKNTPQPHSKSGLSVVLSTLSRKPWIWAWLAALATYLATLLVVSSGGAGALLYAAFTFASFAVIVGVGQMFVVTLGPGNVDLSIPASMTLAGTLALKFMATDGALILPGLLIALGVGLACGLFNFLLIMLLRIPPIIATLSSSFLFQSLAIWSNRGLRIKPPPLLADFATGGTFGIPNIALVALLVSIVAWIVLEKAIAGRWISATGQNSRAARLSGVPVNAVRFSVYVGCAGLAGLTGFMLASFSGGANLNMGTEYLLMSIAVVVIGGSSIAGGNSNVPGIWAAALFMFLMVSMLNSYGLGAGARLILTGVIIVSVVVLANKKGYRI